MAIPQVIGAGVSIGTQVAGLSHPAGTGHEAIYHAFTPKIFHIYGAGIPGTREFSGNPTVFLSRDGRVINSNAEGLSVFKMETGRDFETIEKSLRKPNEKLTKDISYATKVIDFSKFKGIITVDGLRKDANYAGTGAVISPAVSATPVSTLTEQGTTMDKLIKTKILGIPVWVVAAVAVILYLANK